MQWLQSEAELSRGEIAQTTERWAYDEKVARIARHAKKQIVQVATPDDLRLIWFECRGRDQESQWQQVFGTCYGSTNVFDLKDKTFQRECYYFRESAFFRWRESLDGAVLFSGDNGALYLNSYSPRYPRLKDSGLARAFAPAVVDPLKLELEGHAAIADCETPRSQPDRVVQYLAEKYGRPLLQQIDVGRVAFMVRGGPSRTPRP